MISIAIKGKEIEIYLLFCYLKLFSNGNDLNISQVDIDGKMQIQQLECTIPALHVKHRKQREDAAIGLGFPNSSFKSPIIHFVPLLFSVWHEFQLTSALQIMSKHQRKISNHWVE